MIQKAFSFFSLATLVLLTFNSCTNHNKQTLLGDICDSTDTKYSTYVSDLMTSKCISCHNNTNSSGGISVEGHTNVSNNAASILSTIKDGSMPQGGSPLDACTITKLQKWINNGKQNN